VESVSEASRFVCGRGSVSRAAMVSLEDYAGREQSYVKHIFLERYLEALVFKTASTYTHIVYVDGFAGPWQSANEQFEDTSFGIALNALRSNRIDHLADKGYEGAVLMCNVILRPIAGHRASGAIMKYVAGRRDMEIGFAPIKGTRFLAPFRLSAPTLLGTMAIQATQFESSVAAPPGSR
jgi:hypothetical protein